MQNLIKKMMTNNVTVTMQPVPEYRGMGVRFLKDGVPVVSRIIDTVIFESEERVVALLEKLLDAYLEMENK